MKSSCNLQKTYMLSFFGFHKEQVTFGLTSLSLTIKFVSNFIFSISDSFNISTVLDEFVLKAIIPFRPTSLVFISLVFKIKSTGSSSSLQKQKKMRFKQAKNKKSFSCNKIIYFLRFNTKIF